MKFRVINKKRNLVDKDSCWAIIDNGTLARIETQYDGVGQEYSYQLNVGLKDVNGEDLYEGDIVIVYNKNMQNIYKCKIYFTYEFGVQGTVLETYYEPQRGVASVGLSDCYTYEKVNE